MSSITLEWKTEQRGAVKTAFYRPANLTITVKSAKAANASFPTYKVTQGDKMHSGGWKHTMPECQVAAIEYISTRAPHSLWDSEYLANLITPYLQGYPLAILEYGWQQKLGKYCNSPSEVVARHPAIEAHKQWLKEEWGRLNLIEARALNALTFSQAFSTDELILQILGKEA